MHASSLSSTGPISFYHCIVRFVIIDQLLFVLQWHLYTWHGSESNVQQGYIDAYTSLWVLILLSDYMER